MARYVVDDQLTLNELRKYVGVTSIRGAGKLWTSALTRLWEAAPTKVQQKFPKEEVIRGKYTGQPGRTPTPETRAKLSATAKISEAAIVHRATLHAANRGKLRSPETKAKISAARMKHDVTPETRAKISIAQREQWRRKIQCNNKKE